MEFGSVLMDRFSVLAKRDHKGVQHCFDDL